MIVEINYTIGDKYIRQSIEMQDASVKLMNDPHTFLGRMVGDVVIDTLPFATAALEELLDD